MDYDFEKHGGTMGNETVFDEAAENTGSSAVDVPDAAEKNADDNAAGFSDALKENAENTSAESVDGGAANTSDISEENSENVSAENEDVENASDLKSNTADKNNAGPDNASAGSSSSFETEELPPENSDLKDAEYADVSQKPHKKHKGLCIAGAVLLAVLLLAAAIYGVLRSSQSSEESDITVVSEEKALLSNEDAIAAVLPSLVQIHAYTESDLSFAEYSYEEYGSGFIYQVSDDEILVAGLSSLADDYEFFEVTLYNGITASAEIISEGDGLVLYSVSADAEGLIPVSFSSASLAEEVLAVGFSPEYGVVATGGIVCAVGSTVLTDCYILDEMNGGLLVNMYGEAVSVLNADSTAYSGSDLADILLSLSENTLVAAEDRGYLGVSVTDISSETATALNIPQGAYVISVSGSGASYGSLYAGDIITDFGGAEVTSAEDLTDAIKYYAAGDTVTVICMRLIEGEYTEVTFSITLS